MMKYLIIILVLISGCYQYSSYESHDYTPQPLTREQLLRYHPIESSGRFDNYWQEQRAMQEYFQNMRP